MLGPGDVVAEETVKSPCPQGERGNKSKEWDSISDGGFEGNKDGVTYDNDR